MNKQVSDISYKDYFRDFFVDKLSLSICCLSLLILTGNYYVFFQIKELVLFPGNKNILVNFYNDSADNGKSIITDSRQTDSSINMSFILKNGFIRPYVGIGIEERTQKEYNISFYNRIKIDISGEGIKPMFVYFVLKDSSTSFEGKVLGFRYMCQYIEISSKKKLFKLAIDDFKSPDWWFDKYNLSPAAIKAPDWKRMYRMTMATGLTPAQNQEQSIQIYSIVFYRDNTLVLLLMVLVQLIIIVLMFLLFFYRTRPEKQIKTVTINYHAVTLEHNEKSTNNYQDYINENFYNSNLSLHLISKETGVSERNIAESISTQFNCNVKTYINQIRINEAQRLLKETDLNISEIAYKVGFSSPSNFNRVFRNLTGKNPSEFIQNKD